MADDVKNMLDDIINRTNKSYPASAANVTDGNLGAIHKINTPTAFDKGAFKEKLSMYVLKDIIQAMMVDDTSDLDNTIDTAIMRHMKDDCGCSCYDYKTAAKVAVTKDPSIANDVDVKNILENVENYEDFTKLMAEKTTNQVVEQMKNVLKDSNAAPTFDGDELDNKLGEGTKKMSTNDSVNESSIMKIYSTIIYESYVDGQPTISSDMGMEMAFIEYCIDQLDHAFMATPKRPLMARYR